MCENAEMVRKSEMDPAHSSRVLIAAMPVSEWEKRACVYVCVRGRCIFIAIVEWTGKKASRL